MFFSILLKIIVNLFGSYKNYYYLCIDEIKIIIGGLNYD